MRELFRLDGKVAIVTGGSRGIGAAIAEGLAAHGAAVVVASRRVEDCETVARGIEKSGGRALALRCHTGRREEVEALVDGAVRELGRVDLLINNAATNPYFGPMLEISDAAWQKTFDVNVRGYFETTRAVVAHLKERGAPGSILNMASITALTSAPTLGVYGMTKAAVLSMTRTLAHELGPEGIRVNAIAPGVVETRFADALVSNPKYLEAYTRRTMLGRHAQPREIVGAAVYLASDAASHVTGQVLTVDGGFTAAG